MSWFRKRGGPSHKKWSNRIERKRLELSASVEESLADAAIQEEEWSDDFEDDDDSARAKETSLIPPRLSLQSKQLPALCASAQGIVEGNAAIPAVAKQEPAAMIERLLSSAEPAQPQKGSQRLSLRTTKVHLQVVPKPQASSAEHHEPLAVLSDPTTSLDLSAVRALASGQEAVPGAANTTIAGDGVFESGQSEVRVTNARITENSVIVVMLAGDPGPVVVQYVSLQPHYGFTVHLSAPAANMTPFNYALLSGQ